MAIESIIAPLVSVGGLLIAVTTTYLTVRQYYDKRRSEERQRQLEELARVEAARQAELDKHADSKTKQYAAQRDFEHLMRAYETLGRNLEALMKFHETEAQNFESDLKEIKGMVHALMTHVCGSETAVLRFLKKKDDED